MKFTWTRRTITTYLPDDDPGRPPEPRGGPRPEEWTTRQVVLMVTGSVLSMCAGGAMTALLVKWGTGQ